MWPEKWLLSGPSGERLASIRSPAEPALSGQAVSMLGASRSKFLASLVSYCQGLVTQRSSYRGSWATNRIIKKKKKQETFLFTKLSFRQARSYNPRTVGSGLDTWQPKLYGLSVLTRDRCQVPDTHTLDTQGVIPPASWFLVKTREGKAGMRGKGGSCCKRRIWEVWQ